MKRPRYVTLAACLSLAALLIEPTAKPYLAVAGDLARGVQGDDGCRAVSQSSAGDLPRDAAASSFNSPCTFRVAADDSAAGGATKPDPVLATGVQISYATYGSSCGEPFGNATNDLARRCNGRENCILDVDTLRDPAPGCDKEFEVEYICAPDIALLRKQLPPAAELKRSLQLSCKLELNIRTATYGSNCGALTGNVTTDLANRCNGLSDCNYIVDVDRLGDPAPRCSKDFQVEYSCAPYTTVLRKELPGEAGLKGQLRLSCNPKIEQTAAPPVPSPAEASSTIPAPVVDGSLKIHGATYGGNCGATVGNVTTDLANRCNGRSDCNYIVDVDRLGDPAPRCGKDFMVEYQCTPDPTRRRLELAAEAGLKSLLRLDCSAPSGRALPP